MIIQDVLDTILDAIPGAPPDDTVDTVKSGDPSQEVSGIVTTFLATYHVIQGAIERGANLIITHEPTFYSHHDQVDWLEGDPVYEQKRRLFDDHGIVVWRFHDSWHMHRPDGIITGVLQQLGWEEYADAEHSALCEIPPTPLDALTRLLKQRLGVESARVIGMEGQVCRRVGLAVGAGGGRHQIRFLRKAELDVLVCGEINEWEAAEYVRDAVQMGRQEALIVLGHAASEEPGMAWLVQWLRELVPGVDIAHIPAGDPFIYR